MHSMSTACVFLQSAADGLLFNLSNDPTPLAGDYSLGTPTASAWGSAVISANTSAFSPNIAITQNGITSQVCLRFNSTMACTFYYKVLTGAGASSLLATDSGIGWTVLNKTNGEISFYLGQAVHIGVLGTVVESGLLNCINVSDNNTVVGPVTISVSAPAAPPPPSGDSTPDPVNWAYYYNGTTPTPTAMLQITGITAPITLRVTYTGGPSIADHRYSVQSTAVFGTGTGIASNGTFTVSNGQYVGFSSASLSGLAATYWTVTNDSDGGALVDTFQTTASGGGGGGGGGATEP